MFIFFKLLVGMLMERKYENKVVTNATGITLLAGYKILPVNASIICIHIGTDFPCYSQTHWLMLNWRGTLHEGK